MKDLEIKQERRKTYNRHGHEVAGTVYYVEKYKNHHRNVSIVSIFIPDNSTVLSFVGIGNAKYDFEKRAYVKTKTKTYPIPIVDVPKTHRPYVDYIAEWIQENVDSEFKLFKSGIEELEDMLNFRM